MRAILAPHLGRSVIVGGRKAPPAHARALVPRFSKYLADPTALPTPPTSVDYTAKASAALSQVYANDRLGDCVIAGYLHCLGVWSGNANGSPNVFTDDQAIAEYSAVAGYNPADPSTDQGADEYSALQHWKDHPAPDGSQLAGFVQLDPCNRTELAIAHYLFEALYFGFCLPSAWITPFPSAPGFTWDVAGDPNENDGHCVMSAGYDETGVDVCTWGLLGKLTWGAIAKYGDANAVGMVWAMLSPDLIAKGQTIAPSGVDWDSLRADLNALSMPAPPVPS